MKIILNQNKFKKHLEKVGKAIPSSTALPPLYGILIKANQNIITLTASDGNLSIKETIETNNDIKVVEIGEMLIPGRIFKDIILKQDGETTINVENSKAIISSNNFMTEVNLLNIRDFPIINFETIGREISLDSNKLRQGIKDVAFAAADNDRRLILNGVNLIAKEGKLTITATNSFRLAKEEIETNSNSEFNVTLLSRNLKEFLPSDVKGEVLIKVDNTKILTVYKNTTISSKLIDGVYPEVEKLIPDDFIGKIKIKVKEMENLIDKAIVMSESDKKIVRLTVDQTDLTIESRKKEMGSSIVRTEEFEYDGEKFIIPFNVQFLKDALNRFNDEVNIMFVGENKPFVVCSTTNESLTQLILPHRNF